MIFLLFLLNRALSDESWAYWKSEIRIGGNNF